MREEPGERFPRGRGPDERFGEDADQMSDSPEGSAPVPAPVLVLRHAAKSFGAVQALVDGSIELHPGEVHALVGENGAGKSTLVKILAGVYQPDAGELLADGQEITLHGPAAALAAGIAVIYQEPALFPGPARGGEHVPRPPAPDVRPAHRPAGHADGGVGDIRPARGPARPGADRPRPAPRGSAGRRGPE